MNHERYKRHLLLPEVGITGQNKLGAARIVCIGAGGLGAPVLSYLAAAGIGTLGIIDHDMVELSNLQRQVIYQTADITQRKVDAAKAHLQAQNPDITIITHPIKLTANNASTLLAPFDLIIDCTDNFAARYLINDTCRQLKKPNISASIYQFEGQCTLFAADEGPCYRCLYPSPPPEHWMPSCSNAGVLGILPGLLGMLQATEACKYILQIGQSLQGRLLCVDALRLQFREFMIEQNPNCPLCGQQGNFTTLPHYKENDCMNKIEEITVQELVDLRNQHANFMLLDVREPAEYDNYNLGGTLIPLGQLSDRMQELDPNQLIIVHCKSGGRSSRAVDFLNQSGFKNAKNLKGGANAFRVEIEKKSAL